MTVKTEGDKRNPFFIEWVPFISIFSAILFPQISIFVVFVMFGDQWSADCDTDRWFNKIDLAVADSPSIAHYGCAWYCSVDNSRHLCVSWSILHGHHKNALIYLFLGKPRQTPSAAEESAYVVFSSKIGFHDLKGGAISIDLSLYRPKSSGTKCSNFSSS